MDSLGGVEGARIVAVCDVVEALAQKASESTGGEAYTDYEKMLARDDLQALYLSLPVFAHGEPELGAIRRGLPIFVEKPVARDMDTALRVLAEVEKSGLITCVGYQLRYGAGTTAARKLLDGQTVGLVSGQYWCGSGRGTPRNWRHDYARSGGQILEQATHTLDMMRFLCGEVTQVVTRQANRELLDIDCADVTCALLAFESGAIGTLSTSWAYDPADWTHANVLHITFADKLLRWTANGTTLEGGGAKSSQHALEERNIDRVFVDAVRTGDDSGILTPYADGVASLRLCLAINESGRTGAPVTVSS